MELNEAFDPRCVAVTGRPTDRQGILRSIAELAAASSRLENLTIDDVYAALLERENLGSTSVGGGVAIPHCRIESISGFLVGIIVSTDPIEFGSTEGGVHLFPFLIAPADQPKVNLGLLSAIAQLFRDPQVRKSISSVSSSSELTSRFTRAISSTPGESLHSYESERSTRDLVHVFVQNEELFDDILQVFAASGALSSVVLEAHQSTRYLASIPLFASFWSADSIDFSRLIVSVIDSALTNALIRNIEYVCGKLAERDDVMVAVVPLRLSIGTLAD